MHKESIATQNITPEIVCSSPWRLTKVSPMNNYRLKVEFIDGTKGTVDMKSLIHSSEAGVFSALKDIKKFNQVYLEYGVTMWPGELDLAPDAMYAEIKKNGCWILD